MITYKRSSLIADLDRWFSESIEWECCSVQSVSDSINFDVLCAWSAASTPGLFAYIMDVEDDFWVGIEYPDGGISTCILDEPTLECAQDGFYSIFDGRDISELPNL